MADTVNELNKQLDNVLRPLFDNKIFVGLLGLFLAVYAGWLAPALPNSVIGFFDTPVGKLLFIFVIAFVASRDVPNSFQVALIVSIIFLVTLTVLNNLKMKEAFRNVGAEHFGLMEQMRDLMGRNNLMEHVEGDMPPANNNAAQAQPPSGVANMTGQPNPAAPEQPVQPAPPKPMACDGILNKCYTEFTPEQQQQVCNGLFEEPKDNAMELPLENNFKQTNCGGYIRQCMADPTNVSSKDNKRFLNMKASSCPVPANQ
jgi:hypothetical protein